MPPAPAPDVAPDGAGAAVDAAVLALGDGLTLVSSVEPRFAQPEVRATTAAAAANHQLFITHLSSKGNRTAAGRSARATRL
jgi:hypothetical protein